MTHNTHSDHTHSHSNACGHTKIVHNDHVDYIHDGHLHHKHDMHWDECKIEVSEKNPDSCRKIDENCLHDEDCGHEKIPHGDHEDYLVDGRLQHVHKDHIDDHGPIEVIKK